MLKICKLIATRELLIAYRNKSDCLNSILFFIIISNIFPIIIQDHPEILIKFVPLIVWLAFLLGLLLSLDSMFKLDFALGTFEEYYLSNYPLSLLLFVRTFVHLLIILLPVLIVLPVILIGYHLSLAQIAILALTLILAAPAVVFIGSICAAMTSFLSRGGILLVILALPLYIPLLILACASFIYFVDGYNIQGQLALLLASSIIAVLIAPFLRASILKSGLQCES